MSADTELIERIEAFVTQRRDHPDEFDDDWQHDDGAEFWRMMPALLVLAKDGRRWRRVMLASTAEKEWLFEVESRVIESEGPTNEQ